MLQIRRRSSIRLAMIPFLRLLSNRLVYVKYYITGSYTYVHDVVEKETQQHNTTIHYSRFRIYYWNNAFKKLYSATSFWNV